MKRITLITLFSLIVVFNANAKWYCTTHQVYVRAGAGTGFKEIGVLPKGINVDISQISGVWGKTVYKNRDAFISAKFLTEVVPAAANSTGGHESISGWIGGIFGLIIILGMIRLVLIETWRTLTGRGYRSGGHGSTGTGSNAKASADFYTEQQYRKEARDRLDNTMNNRWN
jgi:hypothetical protein